VTRHLLAKHPKSPEGSVALLASAEAVRLECRWPFDLSEDDWISITNEFARQDFERALDSLQSDGEAQVEGAFGELRLRVEGPQSAEFEMWSRGGPYDRSLRISIPLTIEALRAAARP
jgi:hypothetical protein